MGTTRLNRHTPRPTRRDDATLAWLADIDAVALLPVHVDLLNAMHAMSAQNPTVTVTDLAAATGYSRSYVWRCCEDLINYELVAKTPGNNATLHLTVRRVDAN